MTRSQGRTSIKEKHAFPKKRVRSQYKYDFKHTIVQHYQNFDIDETLRRFFANGLGRDAARKLVNKWTKNVSTIATMAQNQRTAVQQRHRQSGLVTVLSVAAEEEIVRWVNELRRDDVQVSTTMLKLKALEVAETSGVPPRIFAASNPWKASFLGRHYLSFRTKNRFGQASPDADNTQGRAFAEEVRAWMTEHGVTKVYNGDQTAVFFEMLPKKTVSERGTQTVWVGCGKHEKQRATAMLLADSDGNMYEPFLVFKARRSTVDETHKTNVSARHGFGRQTWPEIKALQNACEARIYGNETAWWTSNLTVEWVRNFFGDRTSASEPVLRSLDGRRDYVRHQPQRHPQVCAAKAGLALPASGCGLDEATQGRSAAQCGFCSRCDRCTPHVEHGAIVEVSGVVDALAARGQLDASVGEVANDADVVDALTEAVV